MDVPTGVPKAYKLDTSFKSAETRYLIDPDELARRIGVVKAQTG
jgi:2,3-bisphosphoglycerate-dependent phosphoglycerate mutase